MKNSSIVLHSHLAALQATAQALLAYAGKQKIWLFEGEMGAGKTTLIKAICAQLGVQDTVTSPTFALVNEYSLLSGNKVYHFDCYRLSEEAATIAMDVEAYFASGCYCLIEWPANIASLIPPTYCKISLQTSEGTSRRLEARLQE